MGHHSRMTGQQGRRSRGQQVRGEVHGLLTSAHGPLPESELFPARRPHGCLDAGTKTA